MDNTKQSNGDGKYVFPLYSTVNTDPKQNKTTLQ